MHLFLGMSSLCIYDFYKVAVKEDLDASAAAYRVGYESPSQFSREYSRLFGKSPKRDDEGSWHLCSLI